MVSATRQGRRSFLVLAAQSSRRPPSGWLAGLAIHSGWRGTVQNVAARATEALRSVARGELDLVVAIGPHIEACCFEVGDDVAAELAACSSAGQSAVDRSRSKPHVDLRRILHAQLVAAGIGADRIDHVLGCTVCDAERFFSYRRDGETGRQALVMVIEP